MSMGSDTKEDTAIVEMTLLQGEWVWIRDKKEAEWHTARL